LPFGRIPPRLPLTSHRMMDTKIEIPYRIPTAPVAKSMMRQIVGFAKESFVTGN
jgi:hypothetical protein